MIRVVRAETLRALQAAAAQVPGLSAQVAELRVDAEVATGCAARAEVVAEERLRELARAHADRIAAERERDSVRAALEAGPGVVDQALAELRADLDRIRADAADPEEGSAVRGAIALGALRSLYACARRQGIASGGPFDLLAVVLDLDGRAGESSASIGPAPGVNGVGPDGSR